MCTSIHEAAKSEKVEDLLKFIVTNKDVDFEEPEPKEGGLTPLQQAAKLGRKNNVKLLLHFGANVKENNVLENKTTKTALYFAIDSNSNESVRFLINAGAYEKNKQENSTLLHLVAKSGNSCILRLLLNAGANVDQPDRKSRTPLHVAIVSKHDEILRILLKAGAKMTLINGNHPLHLAVESKNSESVALLIEAGADVNVRNTSYDTPLHLAAKTKSKDNLEILRILVTSGADLSAINDGGKTPLDLADVRILEFIKAVEKHCSIKRHPIRFVKHVQKNKISIKEEVNLCKNRKRLSEKQRVTGIENQFPKEIHDEEKTMIKPLEFKIPSGELGIGSIKEDDD